MKRSFLTVVVVLAALGAACGSDNKVGDESLVNFKDQAQQRLGATTTTVAAATTVPQRGALGVGATTTTARPVATTRPPTTIPPEQTYEIEINSDNAAATQFDPTPARVYKGTVVRWVNKDTTARSVLSEDQTTLKSPMIPPGGSWTYKADRVGKFNYEDGTRPYATGTLEVLNR